MIYHDGQFLWEIEQLGLYCPKDMGGAKVYIWELATLQPCRPPWRVQPGKWQVLRVSKYSLWMGDTFLCIPAFDVLGCGISLISLFSSTWATSSHSHLGLNHVNCVCSVVPLTHPPLPGILLGVREVSELGGVLSFMLTLWEWTWLSLEASLNKMLPYVPAILEYGPFRFTAWNPAAKLVAFLILIQIRKGVKIMENIAFSLFLQFFTVFLKNNYSP